MQVLARPMLPTWKDTDVRRFFEDSSEFNRQVVSVGGTAQPLRSMLSSYAKYGLGWVASRAEQVLPHADADVQQWDEVLTAIFAHIMSQRQESELTLSKAEGIVRAAVVWNSKEEDFNSAMVDFICNWNKCIEENGLQQAYTKTKAAQKRAVKLMTTLLQPLAFRDAVQTAVLFDDTKTIDDWNILVEDKRVFYEGVQAAHRMRPGGAARTDSAAARAPTHKTTTMTETSARPKAGIDGPPSGCYHCKGAHYLKDCPTAPKAKQEAQILFDARRREQNTPIQRTAGGSGRLYSASARVAGSADAADGTLTFGRVGRVLRVNAIVDSGASHTFVSPTQAKMIMETSNGQASLSSLEEPMTIRTAANGADLQAWNKINTIATLHDHDTDSTRTLPLELVIAHGLGTNDILLGRDTIAALQREPVDSAKEVQLTAAPGPALRVLSVRTLRSTPAEPASSVDDTDETTTWAHDWLQEADMTMPEPAAAKIWTHDKNSESEEQNDWLAWQAKLELRASPHGRAFGVSGHRLRTDRSGRPRWELEVPWTLGDEPPIRLHKWEDINEVYRRIPWNVKKYIRSHVRSGVRKRIEEMKSVWDSVGD